MKEGKPSRTEYGNAGGDSCGGEGGCRPGAEWSFTVDHRPEHRMAVRDGEVEIGRFRDGPPATRSSVGTTHNQGVVAL